MLLLLASTSVASADAQIVGRVVDIKHRPIESVTVTAGGATTHTSASGIYRLVVPTPGTYELEIAYADAHVTRTVDVTSAIATADAVLDVDADSVIVIHDPRPMVTRPRLADPHRARRAPPYSTAAIEHDAWARAWLLLDVDADGHVARVKLIGQPGHDLDAIAIREAFDLVFDPARDAEQRPMPSLVMWTFEWPAYWWLVQTEGVTTAISPLVGTVPCRGSGPLQLSSMHAVYRDCTGPDLALAARAPWIARPR